MRRSRLGQSKGLGSKLIFVLVALAFVGSGYLIGRYFLSALLDRPAGGEPVSGGQIQTPSGSTDTTTVQIQTKPVTLYRVQIGAFSTMENAEKAAQAAIAKGVGAAVMSPDPLYKVYCGITGSKEAANKLAQAAQPKLAGSVVAAGDTLYVATTEVPSRSFTITGPKTQVEAIQNAFVKADTAIQSLLAFWDAQYLGTESQVMISNMESELSALKSELEGMTVESGLKAAHSGAVSIISDLALAAQGAKEAAGGDSSKVALGTASFVKSIDTYMQELKKLSP
ncbi:MAG TPA: hypothetical protein GX500_06210 [Firmicutes bacterium]|nr:hypothetical protein [Candidatus Fermentithermobacillaceae bacterium]